MAKEKEIGHPVRTQVYRPLVECGNCDLFEYIPVNYGSLVRAQDCPNCKCKTIYLSNRKKETTKYNNE